MKKLILSLLLITHFAHASETDNFTKRDIEKDAREWLNAQMNQSLEQAIAKAKPGDTTSVHQQLFKLLGGLFWAKIEHWVKDPSSPSVHLKFEDSVFRDVGDVRGDENFLRKMFKFKSYYSSGLYRMDEVVFGADKLGHFLQVGYAMYFAKMKKENPNFKDARPFNVRLAEKVTGDKKFHESSKLSGDELVYAYSRFQEDTSWGYTGPMARSFADIAANIEGYRFWSELTDGLNPFIKMNAKGQWQLVRKFDWSDYVNLAWDEAVNRSVYHERIREKVEARIQDVLNLSCTGLPDCKKVFDRYGSNTHHVFNTKCENLVRLKMD